MTDRVRHLTVYLDKDYRNDGVVDIVVALRMVKGVADVTMNIVEGSDHVARMVVKTEIRGMIWDALNKILAP
jgi:hypothetical protein